MPFDTLIYEKQNGLARVTLNRPEVLNVYNVRMRDELWEVLQAIRDDPTVRAMLLTGAGRAFCAGADLTEFGTAPSVVTAREVRWARDVWGFLHDLEVPTVAALHGYVIGSGLEMALLCDVRVAAEGTQFRFPELGLGFIPAAAGTQTLPRLVRLGYSLDMLLSGAWVDHREALRSQLVNRVVPADRLISTAETLAFTMMSRNPLAIRLAKAAIRRGTELPLNEGLQVEMRLAQRLLNQVQPTPRPRVNRFKPRRRS
ncbi:MAG TPA: enoyl-CoA hydratase/isomerase family protein [Alphaproteobacteria bacterium]|nr:enoyl-CoA hydratase/isomerase family protein [Alphaproteobacteria bacterium]